MSSFGEKLIINLLTHLLTHLLTYLLTEVVSQDPLRLKAWVQKNHQVKTSVTGKLQFGFVHNNDWKVNF